MCEFYNVLKCLLLLCILQRTLSRSTLYVQPNYTIPYEWTFVNYTWPSPEIYEDAIKTYRYIPENQGLIGIKIYKNRIFLALPKLRPGAPVTLAYITKDQTGRNSLLTPYPSWEMNEPGNCAAFQSVQSMEIDSNGIMWVIDGIRNNNFTNCPSKIVLLDLNQGGRVVKRFTFPESLSQQHGGVLNDIVIDETDGGFAYITENSLNDPGLLIWSKHLNAAWKFRDNATMSYDLSAANFTVDGDLITSLSTINGIALSPTPKNPSEDRTIFYSALTSYKLYSINSKTLKNPALADGTAWKKNIKLVGKKQSQGGGMIIDNVGNLFYTLTPLNGMAEWNIKTPFSNSRIIIEDNRLIWPDSYSMDGEGYLYMTSNHIYKVGDPKYHLEITDDPMFRILKMFTGTMSYLTRP